MQDVFISSLFSHFRIMLRLTESQIYRRSDEAGNFIGMYQWTPKNIPLQQTQPLHVKNDRSFCQ